MYKEDRRSYIATNEKFGFQPLLEHCCWRNRDWQAVQFHTRDAATGKPDHRRWKDESAERQGHWWWLIAVVAVCQELKQAAIRWRDMVMPDHWDSDKQVEQAYTQSSAPSSTNAVVEEVATHDGVFGSRAAAFRTDCNRLMVLAGRLASVEQP